MHIGGGVEGRNTRSAVHDKTSWLAHVLIERGGGLQALCSDGRTRMIGNQEDDDLGRWFADAPDVCAG